MKISDIGMKLLFSIFIMNGFLLSSCKEEEDTRDFENVNIVGINIDSKLFLPKVTEKVAVINEFEAGKNLSALKLNVLVTNGELLDFDNNQMYDCRKSLPVKIKAFGGDVEDWTLKFVSLPALSGFIVEGVSVSKSDIFFGSKSLTVGVPKGTDLTKLKVSMEFKNGTLLDFQNGKEDNYATKKTFSLKGVDEETIYTYDFRMTTEKVGPATILEMKINGVNTDSVSISKANVVQAYIPSLINMSSANLEFTCGVENVVDPKFVSEGVNLLSGNTKVKIAGTDGIEKEFTLACPKVRNKPLLSKMPDELYFGAETPQAVAFSGKYLVIANYQSKSIAEAPVGVNYYDFTGKRLGKLDYTGTNLDTGSKFGIRKMTAGDDGVLLGIQLGAGAGVNEEMAVYKWKTPSSTPEKFITYSGKSLGLGYGVRAAGINISGNVAGDAVIVIPMAQKKDVAVFTVKGGVVQPNPKVLQIPYLCSYYYSVQPMPFGIDGFVAALAGGEGKGLVSLTNTMTENFKVFGFITSDCKTIKHNNRIYLAYTVFQEGKGAFFRICDITDGKQASYENPVFDQLMPSTKGNGNGTMDADMTIIDGKLYAAFVCTNIGVELYCLDK